MTWTPRQLVRTADGARLIAMMGLFFLVVCAVGILKPIKNSLALDGLGSTNFYKVYLVSAVVVVFVPLFNRASTRYSWKWLLPGVALFFAANLVLFRLLYVEGSAAYGLVFYGWYDLFAAALVTQFFMATQLFFDSRSAKAAYPLVIAGGSLGATLGGAITGFFAVSVGTPNLLLVAAALIAVFALVMPWVWRDAGPPSQRTTDRRAAVRPLAAPDRRAGAASGAGTAADRRPGRAGNMELKDLRDIFGNRHVRLIAGTVLLTIVVKQLVDFQFNALTREVFETRDAVSAFQGKFNAATQWLPLLVLAGLRPGLRRWGVGSALLLLPFAMLLTTSALAIAFGLVAAVMAKAAESSMRYSAERAGREILYVPVPDEIKLKAKAYIDVALEKGLGKVASAVLLAGLLTFLSVRQTAYVTVLLAAVWVVVALSLRREYVTTLSRAMEGRFASLRGLFISLTDATTLPAVRRALGDEQPLRIGFALELLAQAPPGDVAVVAAELNALTAHPDESIRAAALDQLLRIAEHADEAALRLLTCDDSAAVRERAVAVLVARHGAAAPSLLRELLASTDGRVRTATLQHIVRTGGLKQMRVLDRAWLDSRWNAEERRDPAARAELALAAAGLGDDVDSGPLLDPFLDDPDPRVRSSALRSAALLGRIDCCPRMICALAAPDTREAAADALAALGTAAIEPLERALLDVNRNPRVRRAIPRVLARIPDTRTVDALLRLVLADETDQLLDFRTIKALSKLRARHPDLAFDPVLVRTVAEREADVAARYAAALRAVPAPTGAAPPPGAATAAAPPASLATDAVGALLRTALEEAWRERREGVFRCLGLIHPPAAIHQAYHAVIAESRARRANGREWLESTLGHSTFARLRAVLEPVLEQDSGPHEQQTLHSLGTDGDAWVACLASAFAANQQPERDPMELIEKVFLLQRVDLLRGARGAHLALLAEIAEVIDVAAGEVLLSEGEPATAMYVVTAGEIGLHGGGEHIAMAPEQAFGTWALIDEEPGRLTAQATRPSRLLRITRSDFHDLMADHPELALGMLQGLARRMRSLVA
jgi:ATP:ADP antiporter, AAA family